MIDPGNQAFDPFIFLVHHVHSFRPGSHAHAHAQARALTCPRTLRTSKQFIHAHPHTYPQVIHMHTHTSTRLCTPTQFTIINIIVYCQAKLLDFLLTLTEALRLLRTALKEVLTMAILVGTKVRFGFCSWACSNHELLFSFSSLSPLSSRLFPSLSPTQVAMVTVTCSG